jgi:hypothetical protein
VNFGGDWDWCCFYCIFVVDMLRELDFGRSEWLKGYWSFYVRRTYWSLGFGGLFFVSCAKNVCETIIRRCFYDKC